MGGKRARWAVPLTALPCFPPPPSLPPDTSPHRMTSERSIRCPSWFVTRSATEAPRRFPRAAKTRSRELPFGQQHPVIARMFHKSSAGLDLRCCKLASRVDATLNKLVRSSSRLVYGLALHVVVSRTRVRGLESLLDVRSHGLKRRGSQTEALAALVFLTHVPCQSYNSGPSK